MKKLLVLLLIGMFSNLLAENLEMKNKTCYDENGKKYYKLVKLDGFGITLFDIENKKELKFRNKNFHYSSKASFQFRSFIYIQRVEIESNGMLTYSLIATDGSGTIGQVFQCK